MRDSLKSASFVASLSAILTNLIYQSADKTKIIPSGKFYVATLQKVICHSKN